MKRTAFMMIAALALGTMAFAAGPGDHGDWGRHGDRDHQGDWGRGPGPDEDWISLGVQSFEGRNDKESTFTGWAGRHIERVGFRPVDGDARCMSIVATMEDGEKIKLVSGSVVMERGRLETFDLPGRHRNVSKLYMRCRALGDWRVQIEVLTRR